MFGFGKRHEEPEEIPQTDEGFLASLEYSPETTEFANWLLEHDMSPLDAFEGEPDAGPLRSFVRRIFGS